MTIPDAAITVAYLATLVALAIWAPGVLLALFGVTAAIIFLMRMV